MCTCLPPDIMENERSSEEEAVQRRQEGQRSLQQVWSWGAGTEGQLGTGKLEDENLPQLLPHFDPYRHISMLACGGAHVIALTSDGKVMSWGRGTSGQLGHGKMVNSLHLKAVDFLKSHTSTHVSAGWSHSGFVSDTGWLFACGDGSFGQLGLGDCISRVTPAKVSFFDDMHVEQIACGMRHSLVLLKGPSGNQAYSFGSGKRGQLGLNKETLRSVTLPHFVCGFEDGDVVTIAANGDHSAALSADGRLYTWERGFGGARGNTSPQPLASSLRFCLQCGSWMESCFISDW